MSEQTYYKVLQGSITGKKSRIYVKGDISPASQAVGDMAAAEKAGIIKQFKSDVIPSVDGESKALKAQIQELETKLMEGADEALLKENETLKETAKSMSKELEALKKENEALKEAAKSVEKDKK